jgi:hypothetical protein
MMALQGHNPHGATPTLRDRRKRNIRVFFHHNRAMDDVPHRPETLCARTPSMPSEQVFDYGSVTVPSGTSTLGDENNTGVRVEVLHDAAMVE